MNDQEKTREQLLEEVQRLRQQVAEMQAGALERQQTTKAFRDNEEHLPLILESLNQGLLITDERNVISYTNSQMTDLLGYSREEMIGRPAYELNRLTSQVWPELQQRDVSERYETRLKRKDGSWFWAEVSTVAQHDHSGAVIHTIGTVTDITERKWAEANLFKRLVLILEQMSDGVIITDLQGRIIEWNPATERMYGYSRKELLGRRLSAFSKSEQAEIITQQMLHNLQQDGVWSGEVELNHQNGEVCCSEVITVPIKDFHGSTIAILSLHRDITARKRAETELKRRNEELAALNTIAAAVNRSPKLDQILITALLEIEAALGLCHSEIWLLDQHTEQLSCAARHGLPNDFLPDVTTLALGVGLPGVIAASGQPLFIPDLTTDPRFQQHSRQRDDFCSALGIPLMAQEQLVGVMNFFSHYRYRFVPEIEARLVTIGHLIGTAIQNARLFEALQRRLSEQSALLAASTAISSSLDLTTVLNRLAEEMRRAIEVTSVYICDWNRETNLSTVLAECYGPEALPSERPSDLGATYSLFWDFEQQNAGRLTYQALFFHVDDPHLPEFERTHLTGYGAQSILIIPFVVRETIIGYAELWESRRRRNFTPEEIALCQGIAQQGAVAFEHARLFKRAQQEIAERKRAEETLRESEQKYRTLIEQSNDAIYLLYGNKFEVVNRRFEELFGVTQTAANAPDFVFTNIVAPKSQKLLLERTQREHEGQKLSPRYEFTALDKDGREIEVELSVSYPAYRGGLATQGVLRDITERKRAEAERAAVQAQMFQSAKLASIGELAAGVAHEINNPIFAVREYAALILEDTTPEDPAYRMLQTIIHQADRIANIVRNLLTFARPDETRFSPVHLESVWQPVYNLIGQSLLKHNIQLDVDIPKDLPPVGAHSQQLQQVLLNLVNNARDALNEKYPYSHPNKRITLIARAAEDPARAVLPPERALTGKNQVICLTIRDEGVGILPEHRERLFTPFFTTKRPNRGTGLGLSISHKIIENHHGRMEVKSEPGVFTEFAIILPVDGSTSEGDSA